MDCFTSPVRDNDSLSRQLEAVTEMITKLSCKVQVLKSDNTALKMHLWDLHQFHTPPLSIPTEALSSTRDAKTYRNVLTSGGDHPASTAVSSGPNWQSSLHESSVMASDKQAAADGFITVLRKRKENHPSSIPSGVPIPLEEN
jgi:hypothetical protein